MLSYTDLQVTSNFSFLRGASHPEELVEEAVALGHSCIAITDHNTLAGIVRAHVAAKKTGIRLIIGCHLVLQDGPDLLAYPTDKAAYGRLSTMLSEGNLRTEKGQCLLYKKDVYKHCKGLKFIAVPPYMLNEHFDFDTSFKNDLREYSQYLGSHLYLAMTRSYQAYDDKKFYRLAQLSREYKVPLVATNDIYYHNRQRRELQDLLTCTREKCTIHNAGYRLWQNAERHLKTPPEMYRLFRHYPDALVQIQEITDACQFSLSSLKYVYPQELTTGGRSPQEELEMLAWHGAKEKFNNDIPEKVKEGLDFELEFMNQKNYASYFLTVYDFVRFARSKEILCQGRGSAANSVVCYCLGITSVDPKEFDLLFARFMSDARDEPPDIDVDFEHERREEVIQYIYNKYGRRRAGIVATVTEVHHKGAVRDVAKAMGLSADAVDRLAKSMWELTAEWKQGTALSSEGFNPADQHLQKILELTEAYVGFPRQLGQHTGGFVITQGNLAELCPILNARMENRTCIEWNKDDIEALGFLKVDVLALGMLTCIRKAFDLATLHYGKKFTLATIPQEDKAVYDMISNADTIGVFQIESRAQMSMLPRLRPEKFYDLVIEVAIVRPGPIQGNMVHPYLKRRQNPDLVEYPSPALKEILKRTLGVPLFQEQAMEIAIVGAGFTPAQADGLRRSMATFKAKGKVSDYEKMLIDGMLEKGYTEAFARRIFKQLEGFGSYGFPESHAVSFALLVYVSAFLKCHYPDVFACALLNSLPMGFYQPAQLVIDAQKHGVMVRPVDINHSDWDHTLEEKQGKFCTLRLGFRLVKGLNAEEIQLLINTRESGAITSIISLKDAGLSVSALEKLADADAFRSLNLDRRQAFWEVSSLSDSAVGMFKGQSSADTNEHAVQLPLMALPEHVMQDYSVTGLSVKAHPVSFLRSQLSSLHIVSTSQLNTMENGAAVQVAGLVLVRQRPGTASGICFITIEDETGTANLVVFQQVFDQFRKEILRSALLMVSGTVQREGQVIHVVAASFANLSGLFKKQMIPRYNVRDLLTLSPADENDGKIPGGNHPGSKKTNRKVFHEGRNFK